MKTETLLMDKRVQRWLDAYRAENGKEPPAVVYKGRGWWQIYGKVKMAQGPTFEQWAIVLERRIATREPQPSITEEK